MELLQETKTRAGNRQVQASFASREWAGTVGDTLAFLSHDLALRSLGFLDVDLDLQDGTQVSSCETFIALLVKAASQRAWTMASWSELPPHQWASVLHEDIRVARSGLARMRKDAEIVLDAWNACADDEA